MDRAVRVIIAGLADAVLLSVAVLLGGVAVLQRAVLGFGRFPSLVRLVVELLEQEEEHDGVHADPPDEGTGVVAVDEQ